MKELARNDTQTDAMPAVIHHPLMAMIDQAGIIPPVTFTQAVNAA